MTKVKSYLKSLPKPVLSLLVVLMLLLGTTGAVLAKNPAEDLIDNSVSTRWRNLETAFSLYGNPNLVNFPMRGALLKFTERQDQINHPWYTYLLLPNSVAGGTVTDPNTGQPATEIAPTVYYFVTQQYPESTCNFLGSTQDVRSVHGTNIEVQAPSWDGVFYGNCPPDEYFFFDQTTDAMIVFGGPIVHITSDQPLSLYANAHLVSPAQ